MAFDCVSNYGHTVVVGCVSNYGHTVVVGCSRRNIHYVVEWYDQVDAPLGTIPTV